MKANKLLNKKVCPWPKHAVFVHKTPWVPLWRTVYLLWFQQEADSAMWNQLAQVKWVGWIAKFIFIGEKADLLSYCVCLPVLGLQRVWWHACWAIITKQNVRAGELSTRRSGLRLPGWRCSVSTWATGWKWHLVHGFSLYNVVFTLKISFMIFLQQQYMLLVHHYLFKHFLCQVANYLLNDYWK